MSELFEFPPTRSNRAKWALEELGIDYTGRIISFPEGAHRTEEHQRIHPLGKVPAYRTDAYTMTESVAILLQLLDEHPRQRLAPDIGTAERAAYYQWCVFASAEFDPILSAYMQHTMHLPEEQRRAEIARQSYDEFQPRAAMLSNTLVGQDYLLGAAFSGADIAIGYCCNWAAYTGLIDSHPTLVNYHSRLQSRPAYQKVFNS